MTLFENNTYRTSDRLLDIEFLFVDLGYVIGWRAYILTDINYQMFSSSRTDDSSIVHRLIETDSELKHKINNFIRMSRGTNETMSTIRYICWSKPIYELTDIYEVAKTWSEITAYYIRYGGSFGSIQPVLKSRGIITM